MFAQLPADFASLRSSGYIALFGSWSNHTEIKATSDHMHLAMPNPLPDTVTGMYTLCYTHGSQLQTLVRSCKQPVARPCSSLKDLLQKADQAQLHRSGMLCSMHKGQKASRVGAVLVNHEIGQSITNNSNSLVGRSIKLKGACFC